MILYELRVAELDTPRLRTTWTYYFTSQTEAMKMFRRHKKDHAVCDMYRCTVITDLKADDWCNLLASDAPGLFCELTPQDLITDRVLIATSTDKAEAA